MIKFFTADTHFGHAKLLTKMGRHGFASIEDHDAYLLDRINSTVGVKDQLWILGDFAWFNLAGKYRQQIRCRNVRAVLGNHDKPLKMKNVFGEVPHLAITKLSDDFDAVLCHYPMAYWPGSHHNHYHFYGHEHAQREQTFALATMFASRRSMDVGVDNARILLAGDMRPFSEHELIDMLGERRGHDQVAYYKEFQRQQAERLGLMGLE